MEGIPVSNPERIHARAVKPYLSDSPAQIPLPPGVSSVEEAHFAVRAGAIGLVSGIPSGQGVIHDDLIVDIAASTPPATGVEGETGGVCSVTAKSTLFSFATFLTRKPIQKRAALGLP